MSSPPPIFGFRPASLSALEIAREALDSPRYPLNRLCLVVTPNIDHVVQLRRDPDFFSAYRDADIIVCDGWPVALYARLRGHPVRRVAGYDIATELMRAIAASPPLMRHHKMFFVVNSDLTADGLRQWADKAAMSCHFATDTPPVGFLRDPAYCAHLAERIRQHGTSLLLLGVGAPRSEIFVSRHRSVLPPCWAFCLGQAIMVEAGTVRRAPPLLRHFGLEWAWRVSQEPRRLSRRYATASTGFLRAVAEDLMRSGAGASR